MACVARVLVIDNDRSASARIADKLEEWGFHSLRARSGSEAIEIAGGQNPDIVVINADGGRASEIELGEALKCAPPTSHIPVIVIGDRAAVNGASATSAVVDEFLPPDCHDAELFARLNSLVRLRTMKAELDRRSATARKYGVTASASVEPPREVSDAHILIVDKARDERDGIGKVIDGKARLSFAETPSGALDHLNQQSFDAVVVAAQGEDNEVLEFCGDIRNNPRLYNVPVLLIADRESFDDAELPYRRGASDVLYRPLDAEEFKARTDTLVKQQRYRRAMQETYREALHIATSDSLTGLYNHGFLHEHLTSQIKDAERWNKHLSVGYLDVIGMAAINKAYGFAMGDRLLRQIGGLIGRLVRGEDLAARYGGEEFCVILPETPREVAEVALGRIAGVVGHTEFAVPDVSEAVMVRLKVGRASLERGDTPESLIARARADLALELAGQCIKNA